MIYQKTCKRLLICGSESIGSSIFKTFEKKNSGNWFKSASKIKFSFQVIFLIVLKNVKMKVSCHKSSQKRVRLRTSATCFPENSCSEHPLSLVCPILLLDRFFVSFQSHNFVQLASDIFTYATFQEPKGQIRSLWWQRSEIEMIKIYNSMCSIKCVSYCTTKIYEVHVAEITV